MDCRVEIRKLLAVSLLSSGMLMTAACTTEADNDPDLIAVSGFAGDDGRLQRPWSFVHHATLGSYRLNVNDGILSIERTGPEPSATLAQSLPAETVAKIGGSTLVFAADLRANLETDTWGTPVSPTGMVVRMHSPPAGGSSHIAARLGTGRQQTVRLDLSPSIRMNDWQRHELEFDVPEDAERLTVSFAMTAGGILEIRNPSLTLVGR